MNFVAHQYLSFGNQSLQIGNLLGETVKGKQYLDFPEDIQKGILLHRSIDTFTDSHETVKQSSSYFHETQHKFAPIIIDVIYDYFLIKYWNNYSETPFEKFKSDCYQLFKDEYNSLPKKLQEIIFYLLKYDWFENYSTIEGVQKTLKGIGSRAKFENNLHQIIPEFEKNYANLETDFLSFFPLIQTHCKNFVFIDSQV
ncbi:acyl carrier protein phosphodiesterase [Empedobacter falsenii]|uniref:acyl carrier protein phosphodiesterase n=1 Tax=Empedobacter falsenii TaxID=343874 RepID=UPI001C8ECAD5|nr:ACP phosphodiesterase [Empedobacter falsenii]MBY0065441.1 ACP phosphodiesterase [Empedobacter falsenii]